jgi:formylmethanofuran:tetrahydromethanopterin formyltransferase
LTHITGYPKGSFFTRDEAEAAALEAAQAEIDAGGPVDGPINGSVLV